MALLLVLLLTLAVLSGPAHGEIELITNSIEGFSSGLAALTKLKSVIGQVTTFLNEALGQLFQSADGNAGSERTPTADNANTRSEGLPIGNPSNRPVGGLRYSSSSRVADGGGSSGGSSSNCGLFGNWFAEGCLFDATRLLNFVAGLFRLGSNN